MVKIKVVHAVPAKVNDANSGIVLKLKSEAGHRHSFDLSRAFALMLKVQLAHALEHLRPFGEEDS